MAPLKPESDTQLIDCMSKIIEDFAKTQGLEDFRDYMEWGYSSTLTH